MAGAWGSELATWDQVREFVGDRYARLARFGDNLITFGVPHKDDSITTGMHHVRNLEHGTWITTAVKVCRATLVDPTDALEEGSRRAIGMLSFAWDSLCVLQRLPLDGLRTEHVELVVDSLVAATVELRAKYLTRAPGGNPYQWFVD